MTVSGGSLCAGTCRLTMDRSRYGMDSGVAGVIRRRQYSMPSASQISHRYTQVKTAANISSTQSSIPPAVLTGPRLLVRVQSSA